MVTSVSSDPAQEQFPFSPEHFPKDILILLFQKCALKDLANFRATSTKWKAFVENTPMWKNNSRYRSLLIQQGILQEESLKQFERLLPFYEIRSITKLKPAKRKQFNQSRLKIGTLYRTGCKNSLLTHYFRIGSFEQKLKLLGIGHRYLFRRDESDPNIILVQDRSMPKNIMPLQWNFNHWGSCLACCVPDMQEDIVATVSTYGYIHWWKMAEYGGIYPIKEDRVEVDEKFFTLPISATYRLGNFLILMGGEGKSGCSSWLDLNPSAETTFIEPPCKTLLQLKKYQHFVFSLDTMYYMKEKYQIGQVYLTNNGTRINLGEDIPLESTDFTEKYTIRASNEKWICCTSTKPEHPEFVSIKTYIYRIRDKKLVDTIYHHHWPYHFTIKNNCLVYCEYNPNPYYSSLHFKRLADQGIKHVCRVNLSDISVEIVNQFRYFISDDFRKISILVLTRFKNELKLYELELPEKDPDTRVQRCMEKARSFL